MDKSKSIHEALAATLSELGLPAPADIIQTMLMKDGYFVGYKFRYDGGSAILQAGGNTIEFFDERLTSQQARKMLHGGGIKESKQKTESDSVAAGVILQSYLDSLRAR